jgi:nitrous oxide reductase accessory protein NosL
MNYTKDTVGVVRKLKVYKYPKFVAKINLRNGKEIYFSSPKGFFEFYFHPGGWYDIGVKTERDFKDLIVTDYFTTKPINAEDAYYVYGSTVVSPAGDDLIPFASKEQAIQFSKKYHGKKILKFEDITLGLIKWLNNAL